MAKDIGGGGPIIGGEDPQAGVQVSGAAPSSSKTVVFIAVGAGVLLVAAALLWFFVK